MKLLVGDPHAQVSDLEEMNLLMDFIEEKAKASEVESIIFLGDLFHNHNLLRLEVIDFWQTRLKKLSQIKPVIALVGNHDTRGNVEQEWTLNSLTTIKNIDNVTVVSTPQIIGGWAYIPYTQNNDLFVSTANELSKQSKILICHQTFDGSSFDNGMYAPDGIDPELVQGFDTIISGHIHKYQTFSNVVYVGTPRWMGVVDANENKGIWLTDGLSFEIIETDGILPKVVQVELNESDDTEPTFLKKNKNYLVLKGSSQWIAKTSKKYKGLARIVPKPTDTKISSDKQKSSDFTEFLALYLKEKNKTVDPDSVLVYINNI
jgi:DNA repair exonuclease SbcCD nuclease subunit